VNIEILAADTPQPTGLLREDGILHLHPAAFYDKIDRNSLKVWCHHNGRYGLPTVELIAYLRQGIGRRRAIEIGAGHGDLAYHLGIPATDNWCQTFPEVKMYYELTGQPVIKYPDRVEKLDAKAAITKYQPEVVIGSWVTQWCDPNDPSQIGKGNMYGIDEEGIVAAGISYIVIGNIAVHGDKRILKLPHEELSFPFLKSRASKPGLNRIWIWSRPD